MVIMFGVPIGFHVLCQVALYSFPALITHLRCANQPQCGRNCMCEKWQRKFPKCTQDQDIREFGYQSCVIREGPAHKPAFGLHIWVLDLPN